MMKSRYGVTRRSILSEQGRKRKNTDSEDGTPASKASKADEREQELLQIINQLTSKHSES